MEPAEIFMNAVGVAAKLAPSIIALVVALISWKVKGKLDLDKTFEAASDIGHVVFDLITAGMGLDEAVAEGVKKIEENRGHKLGSTLKRKATARLSSIVKNLKNVNR